MPYSMWHARNQFIRSLSKRPLDFSCIHCGIGFGDARGRGTHYKGCAARRLLHHLPLLTFEDTGKAYVSTLAQACLCPKYIRITRASQA
eukprot:6963027-Heterocapsa_arctica.AAC.1